MLEGGMVEMDITSKHLHTLKDMAAVMRVYITAKMEELGQQLRSDAVQAIQSQRDPKGAPWTPLKESYRKWKARVGFSSNIYTMTTSYQRNIAAVYNASEMLLEVGVFRGVIHTGGGRFTKTGTGFHVHRMELYKIAEVLEYGSTVNKVPERPLWRPLLAVNEHRIKTKVGIALTQAMRYVASRAPAAPTA